MLDPDLRKDQGDLGSIQFRGKELTKLKENQIVQTGVGVSSRRRRCLRYLTVFENLEDPIHAAARCSARSTFQRDAAVRQRVEEVAEMIFLKDRLTYADQLSHGQKQWLEIGMLLI